MDPLKLKLIKPQSETEPKFYQKYVVIKREKLSALLTTYMKGVLNVEVGEKEICMFTEALDGMMSLQGSHYFVVNLDEEAGQEAMIKYWSLKGYPRDEIISCMPPIQGKEDGQEKG